MYIKLPWRVKLICLPSMISVEAFRRRWNLLPSHSLFRKQKLPALWRFYNFRRACNQRKSGAGDSSRILALQTVFLNPNHTPCQRKGNSGSRTQRSTLYLIGKNQCKIVLSFRIAMGGYVWDKLRNKTTNQDQKEVESYST